MMTPAERIAAKRIEAVMPVDWDTVHQTMNNLSDDIYERHLPPLMDAYRSGKDIQLSAEQLIIVDGLLELMMRQEINIAESQGISYDTLLAPGEACFQFFQRSFEKFLLCLVVLKESGQPQVQGIFVNVHIMGTALMSVLERLTNSAIAEVLMKGATPYGPI